MKKHNILITIGILVLLAFVIFFIHALNHPELSFKPNTLLDFLGPWIYAIWIGFGVIFVVLGIRIKINKKLK